MLLDRNLTAAAARCGVDISRAQRLVADTSPAGSIGYSQTTAPVDEGRRFSGYNGGRYVSPLNNASVNLFVTIEDGGKRALRARLAEEQISTPGGPGAVRPAWPGLCPAHRLHSGPAGPGQPAAGTGQPQQPQQHRGPAVPPGVGGRLPESDLLPFQASRLSFDPDLANAARSYAAPQIAALLGADAARTAEPAARQLSGGPVAATLAGVPSDLRGCFDAPCRGT
jgi:hypothetical protein